MEATDTMVKAGHRSPRPKLKYCKFENKEAKSLAGPVAQVARQWTWANQKTEDLLKHKAMKEGKRRVRELRSIITVNKPEWVKDG